MHRHLLAIASSLKHGVNIVKDSTYLMIITISNSLPCSLTLHDHSESLHHIALYETSPHEHSSPNFYYLMYSYYNTHCEIELSLAS